jgi:hypothetical protein
VRTRTGGRTWFVRLIMLTICVGSILLLYWSLFVRLLPVTRQHQERAIEMSRLSDEVEQLRIKWDPEAVEQVRARFEVARQSLFAAPVELEQWKTGLERNAASRALETRLTLGEPQPASAAEQPLSRVQADLQLWPFTVLGLTNPPYHRVLGYFQDVVNSPKRVDLIELHVQGNSNSVQEARAVVHVLTGELEPAPSPDRLP